MSSVVTYRRITVGQINPITDPPQPVIPSTSVLTGSIEVYDKFEPDHLLRNKTLRNITSSKTVYDEKNRPYIQETESPVIFEGGHITINPAKNYGTYVFLERHPGNGDNPYRPENAPILFERVKEEKSIKEQLNDEAIARLAINQAHDMTVADARAIIADLAPEFPVNAAGTDVRYKAIQLAKENPRAFVSSSPTEEVKTKIQISDAMASGAIDLDEDNRSWKLMGEKPSILTTYQLQDDPYEALEKALTGKDGEKLLAKIEAEMDKLKA